MRVRTIRGILLLVFTIHSAYAEDLYFGQSTAGAANATSCANQQSAAWFNTAANWGGGAGEIDAGDTAHLCGTVTTAVTFQASGTSGNIITLLFETGGVMTATTWGDGGQAITISSKNYVAVDGGSNGIIAATEVGTARANPTHNNRGVYITASTNIEVKNLTINEMFVRTPGTNGVFYGNGVRIENSSNINVHNNTVAYANTGIYGAYGSGNSAWDIHSNNLSHYNNAIVAGNLGVTSLTTLNIYSNTINAFDDASDSTCGNTFHTDGVQIFAQSAGSSVSSVKVYSNTIGPNNGTCTQKTASIFIEGLVSAPWIYNNLITSTTGVLAPTNGYIYDKPASGITRSSVIFNNTVYGFNLGGNGIAAEEDGVLVYNNIMWDLNQGIYYAGNGSHTTDYNSYFSNTTDGHTDTNGVTSNPNLDGNFRPTGAPIVGEGIDLSAYATTDKDGVARGSVWDIGAYEYTITGNIIRALQNIYSRIRRGETGPDEVLPED